ncbi:TetR/AcrR family transcriptional regulator [Actinophytocola sp. NPDC049390]|uniref:TetR/AcrR family transcriptional regulator n=1 Tax=Actinophytocola sp. NPDC049390 TaxID=3363894 RepID=UPI0037925956
MSKTRLSATERAEQIVSAAVTAFSSGGYAGTSTDDVARLAGVSQPYVIRLFRSKQRLFLAAVEQACGRIESAFHDSGAHDLAGLGDAYDLLLEQRELLGMLLHGFAASSDEEIGAVVRARFGRIYDTIRELTGAEPEEVTQFLGSGMLLTVLAAMRAIGPGAPEPKGWLADIASVYPSLCGPVP